MPAITAVEYGGLQAAYDHFNGALFDAALPDVMIVLSRKANMRGHFAPDRFSARVDAHGRHEHELALNPDAFIGRTDEDICSTLAHEMVHVWQHAHGQPSKRYSYHNKQWAAKMREIGLQPSSTGAVGGKETGAKMSHYILPGGPYTQAFTALAALSWKLNLESTPTRGGERAAPSKVKFSCPACNQNAWGKPDLQITCTVCALPMVAPVDAPIVDGVQAVKVVGNSVSCQCEGDLFGTPTLAS
jgi:SprT-like family